jgi:hypothetical protein
MTELLTRPAYSTLQLATYLPSNANISSSLSICQQRTCLHYTANFFAASVGSVGSVGSVKVGVALDDNEGMLIILRPTSNETSYSGQTRKLFSIFSTKFNILLSPLP